jgi:hypothetical protein
MRSLRPPNEWLILKIPFLLIKLVISQRLSKNHAIVSIRDIYALDRLKMATISVMDII